MFDIYEKKSTNENKNLFIKKQDDEKYSFILIF